MRGVPLRLEIGPRDLAQQQVVLASRAGAGKQTVPMSGLEQSVPAALAAVRAALFDQAKNYLDAHIVPARSLAELVEAVGGRRGFVRAVWCGADACEQTIRRQSGASPRVITDEAADGPCVACGAGAREVVYFARAY
jgi:prolyl-tRNA synthetase